MSSLCLWRFICPWQMLVLLLITAKPLTGNGISRAVFNTRVLRHNGIRILHNLKVVRWAVLLNKFVSSYHILALYPVLACVFFSISTGNRKKTCIHCTWAICMPSVEVHQLVSVANFITSKDIASGQIKTTFPLASMYFLKHQLKFEEVLQIKWAYSWYLHK